MTAPRAGLLGLGRSEAAIDTLLRSEQAVIQADQPVKVLYNGVTIAETPISVSILPQAIRLVVARRNRITNERS